MFCSRAEPDLSDTMEQIMGSADDGNTFCVSDDDNGRTIIDAIDLLTGP